MSLTTGWKTYVSSALLALVSIYVTSTGELTPEALGMISTTVAAAIASLRHAIAQKNPALEKLISDEAEKRAVEKATKLAEQGIESMIKKALEEQKKSEQAASRSPS